jgi:hypothetical protein
MRTSSLLISAILLLVAACQAPGPVGAPLVPNQLPNQQLQRASVSTAPGRVELQPAAVVVDGDKIPLPLQILPDRLIFPPLPRPLKTGDILIGRALNQDFLRRVTRIQGSGNRTEVFTTAATLFEAFREADLGGMRLENATRSRITLDRQRFKIGGVMDIILTLSLDPDFSDTRIRIQDRKLMVRMAPRFKLSYDVTQQFTLHEGGASGNPELLPLKPVGQAEFRVVAIPGWVGPIPVTFSVRPGASLDWGHSGLGRLGWRTDLSGELQAGIELEAPLGEMPTTQTFSDHNLKASFYEPTLEFTGGVRTRINLPYIQVDSRIAGMVGPYLRAGTYIEGSARRSVATTANGTVASSSLVSNLGVNVRGGLTETTLFGRKLANGLHLNIYDKAIRELYRREQTVPLNR